MSNRNQHQSTGVAVNTNSRDFATEYLTVRTNWHNSDGSFATRNATAKECAAIVRAARKAGVELDELALDDQARTGVSA